jgi:hypothetical protein
VVLSDYTCIMKGKKVIYDGVYADVIEMVGNDWCVIRWFGKDKYENKQIEVKDLIIIGNGN